MATKINTELAIAAFNKHKAEKVKMLVDFGEVKAADRITREMSESDFVAGWILALDHMRLLHSVSSPSPAVAQPVGIIANDPLLHGWHMQALVPWEQIGLGTKLCIYAKEGDAS